MSAVTPKALVIGGGVGGLAGAIRLAKLGWDVELFERLDRVGGKMNELRVGAYRWDTGPSLMTMPDIIAELFEFAGERIEDHVSLVPVDPVCRYYWPDGSELDTHADQERMRAALDAFAPGSGAEYERFFRYTRSIYEAAAGVFLETPFHEMRHLLQPKNLSALRSLPRIDPVRTLHQSVKRLFSDPRLVQLFDRYATYNGSSPYEAPATLNIIPYVEFGLGGYYAEGGMYRIMEAMVALAEKLGVTIHTGALVERIIHDGTRAHGLKVNGEIIYADAILSNMDVVMTHRHLIDGFETQTRKLEQLEPSLSGMIFFWGVKGRHDRLAHHNIFFSEDYRQEFNRIFIDRRAPDDPTVYVAITQKHDGTHAPRGSENWFVLLNMPYLYGDRDWERETRKMRKAVLRTLRRHGLEIEDKIEVERVWTPVDFYRRWASNRGSIYGLSSNGRAAAFQRPANRSRILDGLYFAGGSTHPGGGVPLCMLSGRHAATLAHEFHAG
ncbi:phytoene desaturase [bacterium]|nr:phytoene desaturase [bacterium]